MTNRDEPSSNEVPPSSDQLGLLPERKSLWTIAMFDAPCIEVSAHIRDTNGIDALIRALEANRKLLDKS